MMPPGMDVTGPDLLNVGKTCQRLIDAALQDRKPYADTGNEIQQFCYAKNYEKLLYDGANDKDLSFKARVNKGSEFVEVVGPYLYPYDPYFLINPEETADQFERQRFAVEQRYLNYTTKQCERYRQTRAAIDHSLIYGMGTLWTGYNARKKLVHSVSDSSLNLLLDPDARDRHEMNWVARQRIKPRWELIRMLPDQREVIEGLDTYGERPTDGQSKGNPASELVAYWEMYFRVGIHNYMDDVQGEVDDSPLKYCVAEGKVLSAGPWEIPFFQWDSWPVTLIAPRPKSGHLYPAAPIEPGLGHLKALNWIYTLYLCKMRLASRTTYAFLKINGNEIPIEDQIKIMHGEQMETIVFSVNGVENVKLSDFIQPFKFDLDTDGFEKSQRIIADEFARATGLAEILYAGQTDTQLRTAADVNMKQDASHNRINDMKTTVEKAMAEIGDQERFAARFLEKTPERIAELFGAQAAQAWGSLADPQMVAQEAQQRQQMVQMTAQQLMGQALQGARRPPPPGMMPQPPPSPDQVMQQADQQVPPPTLVDFARWMEAADCDLEEGSMRPRSIEQQIDSIKVGMNQFAGVAPTIPGGGRFMAELISEFCRLNNFSDAAQAAAKQFVIDASAPPPPPMPAPPPDNKGKP